MADAGSVTRLLGPLQAGNPEAVQHLWIRYFPRLVGLARLKLRNAPRGAGGDEEDVALSAFKSFYRAAEQGRFPQLTDRDGLWRLLVVITARKAWHLIRDEGRQPHGCGAAAIEAGGDSGEEQVLERALSREPTPEMAAQMAEEYRGLLKSLGDSELEAIAVARMEGRTVEEIAEQCGYVPRSIKRKLHLIREIWGRRS
jgi:DNA-directed RNA polymerase specialized sigma24 family protein